MAPTMKDLGIDRLSIADRIVLVQEIWDSIADNPQEGPLSEEMKQVLDRRIAALEANPNDVLTWEDIKAHIRRRE
jgi:putative addiction module component (TIGR02574 family)